MTNPWNDPEMAMIFGEYETRYPEKETEAVSRAFFRQWVHHSDYYHGNPNGWRTTIARQTGEERKRIWTEVLEEIIEEGVLWPKPEPEPAEMLEYDEVSS